METFPGSQPDETELAWQTSSAQEDNGQGLAVTRIPAGDAPKYLSEDYLDVIRNSRTAIEDIVILVRDSNGEEPRGYSLAEWEAFLDGVNKGEFDRFALYSGDHNQIANTSES